MIHIVIFFLMGLVLLNFVSGNISYTTTTKTDCNDGICTKTLYSGIRYVNEDDTWKPVEQAKSLLGYYDITYLEQDGYHFVYVEDFNYTSTKLILKFQGDPEEFEYEVEEDKIKNKYKIIETVIDNNGEPIEQETEYEFELEDEYNSLTIPIGLIGRKFKFGSNSTTIVLQDANTENLDDTRGFEYYPTREYGASTYMILSYNDGFSEFSILKFKISDIPIDSLILDSQFGVYVLQNGLEPNEGYNFTTYLIHNNYTISGQEWTEGDSVSGADAVAPEVNWNTLPGSTFYGDRSLDFFIYGSSSGDFLGWIIYNVTEHLNTSIDFGYSNVTLYLKGTYEIATENADDAIIHSKESATTGLRPYLNVTYQEPAGEDTCTYDTGDWDMDCSDDCVIDSETDMGGNTLSITGTGFVSFQERVTNYNRLYIKGTDSNNRCKVRFI